VKKNHVYILLEKNWSKKLTTSILTWKVKMGWVVANGNFGIIVQSVDGPIVNSSKP
jgi:hypothetical protein